MVDPATAIDGERCRVPEVLCQGAARCRVGEQCLIAEPCRVGGHCPVVAGRYRVAGHYPEAGGRYPAARLPFNSSDLSDPWLGTDTKKEAENSL